MRSLESSHSKGQKVEQGLLGVGALVFNGDRTSVWNGKILEVDGRDGCTVR